MNLLQNQKHFLSYIQTLRIITIYNIKHFIYMTNFDEFYFVGLTVLIDHQRHSVVPYLGSEFIQGVVPMYRNHRRSKIRFLLMQLHLRIQLLDMSPVSCQLRRWFDNQVESISRCSIPNHEDILRGNFSLLYF